MNKRQKKVFMKLKTKFKALGFNRNELESVASEIDDNLELAEDASEEDVDAAIDKAVEKAEPLLKLVQSVSQRTIQESLKKQKQQQNDDDDDDDDDDNTDDTDDDTTKKSKKGGKAAKNKGNDEFSSLVEKLTNSFSEKFDSLTKKIDDIQKGRTSDTRRKKLEKLVKDTGTFGKSALRNFDKMEFKDDDDFQEYLDEVEADLDSLNQERANQGLSKLGTPPATKKEEEKKEQQIMSDEEIIAAAGGKRPGTN